MVTDRDAKKLAHISNADAILFWMERPAIILLFISSGFGIVLPSLVLLLTNLAYFLNLMERRRIDPNHPTDGDLVWFCEERVGMVLAAVSWLGYPVLESVAISLFFTTNLMYMFILPVFQYYQHMAASPTQRTNFKRGQTIQMEELNVDID